MLLAERSSATWSRRTPTVRVRVKGGYEPPVVHAQAGEPVRIVFRREETASCSEHVVFPMFGKSAMLPPFEDVAIELVPEHAGEYEFTCQMGMLRGRLVVDGDDTERPSSRPSPLAKVRHHWTMRAVGEDGDTVLLAFLAWVCSLPLLLLLSVTLLGWRAGGLLALFWLGVVAGTCFAVCARRAHHRGAGEARDRKPVSRRPHSGPRSRVG